MISSEIKHNVQNILDNLTNSQFIYDLLIAHEISKTSVTRLKKATTIYLKLKEKYQITLISDV
jgi:regulator of sigma D